MRIYCELYFRIHFSMDVSVWIGKENIIGSLKKLKIHLVSMIRANKFLVHLINSVCDYLYTLILLGISSPGKSRRQAKLVSYFYFIFYRMNLIIYKYLNYLKHLK